MESGFREQQVFIVGVGLIGGSLGAALRRRFPTIRVTGVGRSVERLQQAVEQGILTDAQTEITADDLQQPSVIVLCTPVHIIAQQLEQLSSICTSDTLITDGGSVKTSVVEAATKCPALQDCFVGAHPIAGGENSGFEHADADLFQDRLCVLTPQETPEAAIERARRFWQAVGCRCEQLSPEDHDRILGMTSHLPHVVASLLASVIKPEHLPFAGTGFLDTTRVAAGDAQLWTSILNDNAAPVADGLQQMEDALKAFREAIQAGRFEQVTETLTKATELRRSCDENGHSDLSK